MRLLFSVLLLTLVAHAAGAAGLRQVVGSYHYTYGPFTVYDARLLTADGVYSLQAPFELALTYRHALKGTRIVAQGLKEMRSQGYSAAQTTAWQPALQKIIPDVATGDTLVGTYGPGGDLTITKNGKLVGQVRNPALTEAFFNIWLGPKTSEPAQRRSLLGEIPQKG